MIDWWLERVVAVWFHHSGNNPLYELSQCQVHQLAERLTKVGQILAKRLFFGGVAVGVTGILHVLHEFGTARHELLLLVQEVARGVVDAGVALMEEGADVARHAQDAATHLFPSLLLQLLEELGKLCTDDVGTTFHCWDALWTDKIEKSN